MSGSSGALELSSGVQIAAGCVRDQDQGEFRVSAPRGAS